MGKPKELKNLKCSSCNSVDKIEVRSVSVWESGINGIYYVICTVCNKEGNVFWDDSKTVSIHEPQQTQ